MIIPEQTTKKGTHRVPLSFVLYTLSLLSKKYWKNILKRKEKGTLSDPFLILNFEL